MEALARGVAADGESDRHRRRCSRWRRPSGFGRESRICAGGARCTRFARASALPRRSAAVPEPRSRRLADHEDLPAATGGAGARARACLPRNVAVEFLEARLEDVGRFGALADALRKHGFLVVLDDVGAGHSNLDRIPLFRPDVIKIDRSLVTGVEARLLQAGDVQEPGQPVPPHRRAGGGGGDRDRGRGDRGAGAGGGSAAGLLPVPPPGRDGVRRAASRAPRSRLELAQPSRATWSARSTSASASTGASTAS